MILTRYIAKEVMLNTAAVTAILVLVAVANQFVVFLSRAAAGELPVNLVLTVVALNIPFFLSFLLPFGFFIGILLAYGRLYTEAEMTVMLACGFSIKRLVWTTLVIGSGVAVICATLTFWTTPASMFRLEYLFAQVRADVLANFIKEGRFQTWEDGKYVVYIGEVDEAKGTVNRIFIAEQPQEMENSERLSVLTAKTGHLMTDPHTQMEYMVVEQGERYLGIPGNAEYGFMSFDEYGVRVPTQALNVRQRTRIQPTATLFKQLNLENRAELQWRLTLPISILVLAIIAVPLSRVPPRKGRYYAIFPALVVMLIYTLSLMVTRTWVFDGLIPPVLGLIWPHTVALLFGLFLLSKQTHWLQQVKQKMK